MQKITVDGIEYAPVTGCGNVRIVVLQRGWVAVGYYERDGDNCRLLNASIIRAWGTSKGLGELAESGPTSSTKLDKCNGAVEFHRLTEIFTLQCEESKWKSLLK